MEATSVKCTDFIRALTPACRHKHDDFALQSATSALRRRVLYAKGNSPAEQRRLTHELSDISNTANPRPEAAADQDMNTDPTTIVALLNVAGLVQLDLPY